MLNKKLRYQRKKLREIAHLESLKYEGRSLRAAELEKIARRPSLEAGIADLVGVLLEVRDATLICKQDDVALAFADTDQNCIASQAFAGPSVCEKSTATPGTVTPADSTHSNSHSEDAADVRCPAEVQRTEPVVIEPVSRPSLVTVDVRAGKHSTKFRVPAHMQFMKSMGTGSYGSVAAFWDNRTNERVAIKKVPLKFSSDLSNGVRALREIRVLGNTDHNNIVKMHSFYCDRGSKGDDIYIVQECVDIDLHSIIQRSGAHLTEKHHRHILFGTTRGLAYLHSLDVAHRDMKPANILVNIDCSVKICDFNLARGCMQSLGSRRTYSDHAELSDYVCTRWYRAPELMLFKGRYGTAVDVWSLGCIICEVITTKPIFKGSNSSDQIHQIFKVIGFPHSAELEGRKLISGASRILNSLSDTQARPWQDVLPSASLEAICMISCLLRFSPEKRITARDCLHQVYFSKLHSPSSDNFAQAGMDWSFDELANTEDRLRSMLRGEGCAFVSQCEPDTAGNVQ